MQDHLLDVKLMADDVLMAYRGKGFKAWTESFNYNLPLVPGTLIGIGDGGPGRVDPPPRFAIDADSLYVWLATALIQRNVTDPFGGAEAANMPTNALRCRISTMSDSYQLNGPGFRPIEALTGVGEWPHFFAYPMILAPSETVLVELDMADESARTELTLIGVKLFTEPYTRTIIRPDH